MSYRELDFDSHNVGQSMAEIKQMFQMHFERANRHVLQQVYQRLLAVDFDEFINAGRYQRTTVRRGQRNGSRPRTLLTSAGVLQLAVPRDRAGEFQPSLFERYRRVEKSLEAAIMQTFLSGVSTRKVGDVLAALCGSRVSASKVSTVTQALNQAVQDFANSPIVDDFVFLFLDALTVSIRYGLKAKPTKLLVAYGIRADGTRRLISFQRAKSESAACWTTFLENLRVRGLRGSQLWLVTMDGGPGLWAAVDEVYPLVPHQLCWVHKLRNVAKYCPVTYRQECVREAANIMYQSSEKKACQTFRRWQRRWQKLVPKAVQCLEKDFDKLIPIFTFPDKVRKTVRTTNVIERSFREVRRRLSVMGYFQDSSSCDRIVYALFAYFNNKWLRRQHQLTAITQLQNEAA
jgi:transposase-like protein